MSISTSSKNKKKVTQTPAGWEFISRHKKTEEFVLKKNGLRVLFTPISGTKTVTTNLVYLIGSRHERRGETGSTHMLEHMMFKYTKQADGKCKLLWKELEEKGALMNATTWFDRTNYYFCMPSVYLDEMVKVEADRMRNLLLDDTEFQKERENVLSEYNMVAGNPEAPLWWAMMGTAFHAHGYGHDTIGHRGDIENFTTEQLKKFYDTYYWPENAVLVVVGDVEKKEMLNTVKKYFSNIEKNKNSIYTSDESNFEPKQEGERRVVVKRESVQNIISFVYKGVSGKNPDWIVIDILLQYVAGGKNSVLHKKLIDTHMASSVSIESLLSHDDFVFGVTVYVADGIKHEEVEKVIETTFEELKIKKIQKKELERIKKREINNELFQRDGTFSTAQEFTSYVAIGDWKKYYTILDDIKKVSVKDILRVSQKYIKDSQKTVGYFIGNKS